MAGSKKKTGWVATAGGELFTAVATEHEMKRWLKKGVKVRKKFVKQKLYPEKLWRVEINED